MAYASSVASTVRTLHAVKRFKRVCPQCGSTHSSREYKWCAVCRDLGAAYHKLYRDEHKQRGLCTECVDPKQRGHYWGGQYVKCQHHLEYHRTSVRPVSVPMHRARRRPPTRGATSIGVLQVPRTVVAELPEVER
jgi:predicted RNA-binding Zn-ribbon protein involved in translation (DUF1610 family)